MTDGYNSFKKVRLMDINRAFVKYITEIELTRTEYLFVANIYDVLMKELITGSDVDE